MSKAIERVNSSSISSEYNEEDELFDYINLLDIKKIEAMLSKDNKDKELPIWEYRSKENQNSTVLNISVYRKSFNITKLLIEFCKKKNPEILKKFINTPNDQGIVPLHYASFRGDIQIIKLLIENGADITKTTNRQLNVIHYCAQGNKPNALMFFYLKLKEDLKTKDKYELIKAKDGGGSTPLHWSVYSLAEDLLLYLINLDIFDSDEERNDFINQLDNQGFSPLHLTVTSKSPRIAIKLLQNGADPSILDKNKETPLQLARKKQEDELIQIFKNIERCQFCNFKAPVKQIKKSHKNIICVFVFQIISIIILFGSILPIFLYYYNNLFGKISFFSFIALLVLFFVIYFFLLSINPGLKAKKDLKYLEELINNNKDLTKYCYKCFIKKTSTSKHCIICNRCYDNFDHHCFWINKCVAKRNYPLFIIFLFEVAFYLITILTITILSLVKMFQNLNNKLKTQDLCKKYNYFQLDYFDNICQFIFKDTIFLIHLILNISLILIILFFLIPEILLLILHIHVLCTNYKEEKNNRNNESFSTNTLLNEGDNSLLPSNNTSTL